MSSCMSDAFVESHVMAADRGYTYYVAPPHRKVPYWLSYFSPVSSDKVAQAERRSIHLWARSCYAKLGLIV